MSRVAERVARRFLRSSRSDALSAFEGAFGVDAYPPELSGPESGPWTGLDDHGRRIVLREGPDGNLSGSLDRDTATSVEELVRMILDPTPPDSRSDVMANLRSDVYWIEPQDLTPVPVSRTTVRGKNLLLNVDNILEEHSVTRLDTDPDAGGIVVRPGAYWNGSQWVAGGASGPGSPRPDESGLVLRVVLWFAEDDWEVMAFGEVPASLAREVDGIRTALQALGDVDVDDLEDVFQPKSFDKFVTWDADAQEFVGSDYRPFGIV